MKKDLYADFLKWQNQERRAKETAREQEIYRKAEAAAAATATAAAAATAAASAPATTTPSSSSPSSDGSAAVLSQLASMAAMQRQLATEVASIQRQVASATKDIAAASAAGGSGGGGGGGGRPIIDDGSRQRASSAGGGGGRKSVSRSRSFSGAGGSNARTGQAGGGGSGGLAVGEQLQPVLIGDLLAIRDGDGPATGGLVSADCALLRVGVQPPLAVGSPFAVGVSGLGLGLGGAGGGANDAEPLNYDDFVFQVRHLCAKGRWFPCNYCSGMELTIHRSHRSARPQS